MDYIIKLLASNDVSYYKKDIINYFKKNEHNDEVIKRIVNIKNPIIYSRFANIVQNIIDIHSFDEKRNKIIERIINTEINYDKEMFTFFLNISPSNNLESNIFLEREIYNIKRCQKNNTLEKELVNISNKWLDEYIIYYYFHDNYYNFLVNLNQILRYIGRSKTDLINKDNLEIYKDFYDIGRISFKDKMILFKKYLHNENIQSMFYDDTRKVKNHSYKSLVNNALKLDQNLSIYNKELSDNYGIPVYYLNGEPFKAFVRCIPNSKKDKENFSNYMNNNLGKNGYSFSYIGDKNIGVINDKGIVFLYDNINPNNIMHVYHGDSNSSYTWEGDNFISNKVNEVQTPDSLIYDTEYYNEIVVKRDNDGIRPSAIFCFDKISDNEIELARKYNLYIVLINSIKYRKNEGYSCFDESDTYSL